MAIRFGTAGTELQVYHRCHQMSQGRLCSLPVIAGSCLNPLIQFRYAATRLSKTITDCLCLCISYNKLIIKEFTETLDDFYKKLTKLVKGQLTSWWPSLNYFYHQPLHTNIHLLITILITLIKLCLTL